MRFPSTKSAMEKFQSRLAVESRDSEGKVILSEAESKTLAPLVGLRPLRSSRGVQVYLETHSVKAMSEALGHKKHNPNLLSRYLPDVLLSYFNDRWIRIFQNAIIYEAMKGSKYLLDAIDLDTVELEKFLKHHQLGELPEHIRTGQRVAKSVDAEPQEVKPFDELIITLSTPLLQILIAITAIVESAGENEELPAIIEQWYETSAFIIKHLASADTKESRFTQSLQSALPLLELARSNPLDHQQLKDNLWS